MGSKSSKRCAYMKNFYSVPDLILIISEINEHLILFSSLNSNFIDVPLFWPEHRSN